jgi:hypothetical protein
MVRAMGPPNLVQLSTSEVRETRTLTIEEVTPRLLEQYALITIKEMYAAAKTTDQRLGRR